MRMPVVIARADMTGLQKESCSYPNSNPDYSNYWKFFLIHGFYLTDKDAVFHAYCTLPEAGWLYWFFNVLVSMLF